MRWSPFAVLFTALVAGCAGAGNYVWVQDLAREPNASPGDYLINVADTVSVKVLNNEAMSTRAKVRSDGRIAVPILGEIDARGKRPSALRAELEARLKEYLNTPSVTVNVEEFAPMTISVLGEVPRPGTFNVDPSATVAQVLANAGGLTEYADRDRIFVVRTQPTRQRVRFTWEAISRGDLPTTGFALRPGDIVVVE
jgi:polysaccharide export outer membrane protein